jgi:hypothetical protein
MLNGAIKGAMLGAAANASVSLIGDAYNGNLSGRSVGRAFGAGVRGGLMGGAIGGLGGAGYAFMGPGRMNRPRRPSPGNFIRPGGVGMMGGVNLMNRAPRGRGPNLAPSRMQWTLGNRMRSMFGRGPVRPGTRGRL